MHIAYNIEPEDWIASMVLFSIRAIGRSLSSELAGLQIIAPADEQAFVLNDWMAGYGGGADAWAADRRRLRTAVCGREHQFDESPQTGR